MNTAIGVGGEKDETIKEQDKFPKRILSEKFRKKLSNWKNPQPLDLSYIQLTTNDVDYLIDLSPVSLKLKGFEFSTTVDFFSSLKNLRILDLSFMENLQPGDLLHLSGITALEELKLWCCNINNILMHDIASLSGLRVLDLTENQEIGSYGLNYLQGLKNLENLSLYNCVNIGDNCAKTLAHLKSLTKLNLLFCGITDRGLVEIVTLPKLLEFRFDGNIVKKEGAKALISHPTLKVNNNVRAFREAVKEWHRINSDCGSPDRPEFGQRKSFEFSLNFIPHWELYSLQEMDGLLCLALDNIDERGIKIISEIACLEALSFSTSHITNSDLQFISRLKNLFSLCFSINSYHWGNNAFNIYNDKGYLVGGILDQGIEYLSNLHKLRHLSLSIPSLGNKGLKALGKCVLLTSLNLLYTNICSNKTHHLARLKNLLILDLGSNNISEKHVKSFSNISLSEFYCVGGPAAERINMASYFPWLQSLNITVACIKDEDLEKLAPLQVLKDLDLSQNFITGKGLLFLPLSLKNLNLRSNQITDKALPFLASMVSLTKLDLAYNKITELGLQLLTSSIAETNNLTNLTDLDLSGNDIGDEGINAIAESPNLGNIVNLSLIKSNIGDNGVKAIVDSNKLKKLDTSSLYLGWNNIGDKGAQALAESDKLENLTTLYLNNNKIGDEGAQAFVNAIQEKRFLPRVSLRSNKDITSEMEEQFRGLIEEQEVEKVIRLVN